MSHAATRALVTGGSQGMGYAVAQELIAQGCRALVITGRDVAKGQAAAERLAQAGAEVTFLAADLSDIEAVTTLFERAQEALGEVNALVNAAADTARGTILDTTPALWDRLQATNLRAPFFLTQAFAKAAIAGGHGGGVVNILSVVVHGGLPFLAPYAASKAGLLNVTKNSAAALAPHGIRVNSINVGWMETPGEDMIQKRFHDRADGWEAEAAQKLPFGRLVQPEEVARQVAFFLSAESGIVTGATLDFDQQVVGIYPDTND